MRDLINLIQQLNEGVVGMSAGEIIKYESRFQKFIEKIRNKSPFTTIDGNQVVLDPSEAKRFEELYNNRQFVGRLMAKPMKGDPIPISSLAKTREFGGAAAAAGQDPAEAGKEALIVKPSDIMITDKNIPAHDFYETIINNKFLQRTDYGHVVMTLAMYIVSDEEVRFPERYLEADKAKVRTAIVDYAGEYLGILALLYNRSRFPAKARFLQWLGGSTDDLVLNFPSKANTNLADSYATITNPDTMHTLNISSKGTGGGAAPAISGLKISKEIENEPRYANVVQFIKICKEKGTIAQAFDAMDLIYKSNRNAIDEKWIPFLPFASKSPELQELAAKSVADKKQRIDTPLPAKYRKLYSDIKAGSSASEGGKLIYAIKKYVAELINSGAALPEFKDAVLQVLEMNFIQQYTDYKGGQLFFATQWPAKLDGDISVENKSSASDPTAGGFSFKLGRVDDSVSSEPDEPEIDTLGPLNYEKPELDIKARKEKTPEPQAIGRERRKK